jgi:hypothetical protein
MTKKRQRRRKQNQKPGARNREWMVAMQEIRRSNSTVPLASATTYNRAASKRDWKREA